MMTWTYRNANATVFILTVLFGCLIWKMQMCHLNNQVETLLNIKPLSGSGSKSINIYMTRNKYHHSRAILWVLRGHLWAWLPRALPSFLVVSWFSFLIFTLINDNKIVCVPDKRSHLRTWAILSKMQLNNQGGQTMLFELTTYLASLGIKLYYVKVFLTNSISKCVYLVNLLVR